MTPLPRLPAKLLTWRLSGEWREFVLGDLEEEFAARAAADPAAARRWLWRQTIRCLLMPPPSRGADRSRAGSEPLVGEPMVRTAFADFRYAARLLLRAPGFTLAVVAVLALGIGANTAIFSIVNAVLLRPLPFEEPARLVRLFHVPPQSAFPGTPRFSLSAANFYDWQRESRSFERMAMFRFRQFTLTGTGNPESIVAGAVGAGFFEIVRTQPAMGRVFRDEEDFAGQGRVVILSDGFWRSHFGGAADVVGRTMQLNGSPYTIVGVMPAGFSVASWAITARPIWVPMALSDTDRAVRENHNHAGVARLRPGVSVEQGISELTVISKRLEEQYPQANAGWGATLVPLQELIVGEIRTTLLMLLAAVGLVLLISCANVGNLLLARAFGRRKEIAVRAALGAGRRRVFQQLIVESMTLALAGGLAGLGLAQASLTAGAALLADQIPRADEITVDMRVLLFALAASLATGIIAGVLPALRAGTTDLNSALKEGGRSDSAVGLRTRRALIVAEVALSVILLMAAAVMFRSLAALRHVNPGYEPRNVLTLRVSLPQGRYQGDGRMRAFFEEALQRMRALPGVQAAGAIDDLPSQGGSVQPIVLEGRTEQLPRDQPTVEVRKITPGYLRAMGIPVVRGRDVAANDQRVMLVSAAAAKLLWGDGDPIGRRVTLPLQSRTTLEEVVGVVGDVKQGDLSGTVGATVYQYSRSDDLSSLAIALRTSVPPATLAQSVTAVIRSLDPEQPVEDVAAMEDVLDQTLTAQRFSATLLGLFAAVALALSSVGIYSVLSYIVWGRSREIGIRTALGARTADVLRLVIVEGMRPAVLGIAIGAVAALATGTLMTRLVFGISATDPVTLAGVAGALALVALVASLLPAYRAAQLDPLKVLRGE